MCFKPVWLVHAVTMSIACLEAMRSAHFRIARIVERHLIGHDLSVSASSVSGPKNWKLPVAPPSSYGSYQRGAAAAFAVSHVVLAERNIYRTEALHPSISCTGRLPRLATSGRGASIDCAPCAVTPAVPPVRLRRAKGSVLDIAVEILAHLGFAAGVPRADGVPYALTATDFEATRPFGKRVRDIALGLAEFDE